MFSKRLIVFMYHMVVPQTPRLPDWCMVDATSFEQHQKYLKRHYRLLPLAQAVTECLRGDQKKPTAAITFDDGYQNNHDIACPILKALNIPATIFLTTSLIDTDETDWFGRLYTALLQSKQQEIACNGRQLEIQTWQGKTTALKKLQAELKTFHGTSFQKKWNEIIQHLGGNTSGSVHSDSPFRMLDTRSIRTMQHSGIISFGAHTHTHPILSQLPENDQQREIKTSINIVERITGSPCRLFAYPNGRQQDFSPATIALLRESNIQYAFTTIARYNTRSTQPFSICRVGVGQHWSMTRFRIAAHPRLTIFPKKRFS
jgi:peptidoglycan/xylan/chitin deacetylase (PgdA/CDA1 family)